MCTSCRFAKIVKGPATRDEIVHCAQMEERIGFQVTTCTEYVHRQHPAIWHMEDIAWILRTDPKRKHIGFVKPDGNNRSLLRPVIDDD